MPDIHGPNFWGDVRGANNPGNLGQKVYSNGPNNNISWEDGNVTLTWVDNDLSVTVDNASDTLSLDLVSSDVGNIASVGTDGRVFVGTNTFLFTSAINTSHVINHNLGNQYPNITVYDTATGAQIIPATIIGTTVNQTFAVAVAIAGTIIG